MATPIDDNAADGQLGKSRWQLLSIRYTLLEKTAKIFCIVCHWNTAPASQRDISYLCKTEKEINNIVVGDKL